ncbi:MAG TPA: hypothetical protein VFW98_07435 [Gemmatimonadaceae bacterium]|nr:hypothetical protein [Gemmatimonadaceae bacterium]
MRDCRWMPMFAMFVGLCVAAPVAHAQAASASSFSAGASSGSTTLGPSIDAERIGVQPLPVANATRTADVDAEVAQQSHGGLGKSEALMIVGGAAVVTGAIIGGGPGALIAVAGVGVGLYGLYLYLQ